MVKIITMIFFYVLLILSLITYCLLHPSPVQLEQGVYMQHPLLIKPFELTDNQGSLFTEQNFKGHWSLLFFGFSSCPKVCPLTLHTIKQTYEALAETERPQVILVSVDPEHDSLPRLNEFVHQFNERFIALRGSMPAIRALQNQLHVSVSTTAMSHGNEIVLINPEGKVQAYFYYPIAAQSLRVDLQHLFQSPRLP